MTQTECECQEFPHNRRCRYTTGFFCEDCHKFFAKDSPTYLRYALPSDLCLVVHNIGVAYVRKGLKRPHQIAQILKSLDLVGGEEDRDRREQYLNQAFRFMAAHKATSDSAVLLLKDR